MAYAAYADNPVITSNVDVRVGYLRKVGALTLAGLTLSGVTGLATAGVIAMVPALASSMVSLVVILGAYAIAHYGARSIVFNGGSSATKLAGFALGSASQGVAMGYLLLTAILLSAQQYGNPFVFVVQAMALVGMTAFGMFAYLMTGPRDLSMVKGALAMLSLPMLALMGLSFVAFAFGGPLAAMFGGPIGLAMSALFVVVSAGGLLYQLNVVMHQLPASRSVEGAYMVTMGLLVLFWNVLVLIMRLQRR